MYCDVGVVVALLLVVRFLLLLLVYICSRLSVFVTRLVPLAATPCFDPRTLTPLTLAIVCDRVLLCCIV